MASHHHLHHHPTAVSHCYCFSPYSQCHHPPPPPPPPSDCLPLYHPPPQPHPYPPQTHLPNSHQTHPHLQERYFEEKIETEHTIASLLRRIASLESALRGRSSSSSSYSLRAAAVRTIQTHFRAFLLRRSRTLRQLKELASIKSALGFLKSSVSKKTYFDYDVVHHQAMTLVLKLDTIQGFDPMIRDGKSSVRRDLNNFFDFIDESIVGRKGLSSGVNIRYEKSSVKTRVPNGERKMGGNAKCGGLKSVGMQKLRSLVERIDKLSEELAEEEEETESVESPRALFKNQNKNGALVKKNLGVQSKSKKSVSFADGDGKVYRLLRRNSEPNLDDDADDDDVSVDRVSRGFEDDGSGEVEEIGVVSKEAEDDDEGEDYSENGSDAEKDSRTYTRSGGDNMSFSPPLPLKMETRADLIEKRKKLADNY